LSTEFSNFKEKYFHILRVSENNIPRQAYFFTKPYIGATFKHSSPPPSPPQKKAEPRHQSAAPWVILY
jgi:hypothetical protein